MKKSMSGIESQCGKDSGRKETGKKITHYKSSRGIFFTIFTSSSPFLLLKKGKHEKCIIFCTI